MLYITCYSLKEKLMKKFPTLITLFAILTLFLAGCALQAFDGVWTGDMISVQEDTEEKACGAADLNLTISNGKIEGIASVGYGYELTVKGVVTNDGQIKAELWGDDDSEVVLTGLINGNTAGGTWNDNLGCFGTFELSQK